MKKIKDVEQALSLFEEYSIRRGDAINNGSSKLANYCYDNIQNVASFLRGEKELSRLAVFYNHSNAFVRLDAAAYLLPVFEKESLKVMKEVTKMKGIVSLEAEMTIQEWKNGNLRNFYTL